MKPFILFVVVGRLGKSLTTSKLLPMIASGRVSHIYVFREHKGHPIEGVTYITSSMPGWIKPQAVNKVLQRLFEPLQIAYYALKLKPYIINGFQLIPKGMNSVIAAKLSKTKCMMSSIGGKPEIDTYFKYAAFWRFINVFVLKHADVISTKGRTVTDYMVQLGVDKSKIFTFNGAIDTRRFIASKDIVRDIDLLYVGALIELKGPDRFVKIAKGVSQRFPKIRCMMLGDGDMESVTETMIKTSALSNNISIEGYIEKPESYFQRAKIVLMPSRSEGLATAMLEAMACGCVPIVSNVGCMNEAAIQNETAILVEDYLDVDSFIEKAIDLLSDADEWSRISNNAITHVHHKYCIAAQAEIYSQIITYVEEV
jgi:glycosyltransferase involved in cell wall biosynthesis